MAQLNDEIATRIMGEIDVVTRRIDATSQNIGTQIENQRQIIQQIDISTGQFAKKINELTEGAAEEAKHQVSLGLVAAINRMGPDVGKALIKHAEALNQVDRVKWIGGAVVVVVVALSAFGWIAHTSGYSSGFESGHAVGHAAAADEKAMAAWANTDQGRMAYELALAGGLEMLSNCTGRGWRLSKNECIPQPYKEGEESFITGWKVSKSAGGAQTRKINMGWWEHLTSVFEKKA